jgi:hypothetical protein
MGSAANNWPGFRFPEGEGVAPSRSDTGDHAGVRSQDMEHARTYNTCNHSTVVVSTSHDDWEVA